MVSEPRPAAMATSSSPLTPSPAAPPTVGAGNKPSPQIGRSEPLKPTPVQTHSQTSSTTSYIPPLQPQTIASYTPPLQPQTIASYTPPLHPQKATSSMPPPLQPRTAGTSFTPPPIQPQTAALNNSSTSGVILDGLLSSNQNCSASSTGPTSWSPPVQQVSQLDKLAVKPVCLREKFQIYGGDSSN